MFLVPCENPQGNFRGQTSPRPAAAGIAGKRCLPAEVIDFVQQAFLRPVAGKSHETAREVVLKPRYDPHLLSGSVAQ